MELTLDDEGTHTLFGNHDENLRLLEDAFDVKISRKIRAQTMQSISFKKLEAPSSEFGQVAGINTESFESFAALLSRSCRHRRMHRAHVNVDRIQQQRRAVWIRVEPAFESNLFEVLRLSRSRLDFGFV